MPDPWPHTIPAGLRHRLDSVLTHRNVGAAEIWGEVRDWLEWHGVEKPDHVVAETSEGTAQQDQ